MSANNSYKINSVYRSNTLQNSKDRYWANRNYFIEYGREYTKRVRKETLEFVGGEHGVRCRKCNFDDVRALQIDHVNGGGLKEIRELKNNRKYLELIKKNPTNYQILCANCNWIKKVENNENKAIKI